MDPAARQGRILESIQVEMIVSVVLSLVVAAMKAEREGGWERADIKLTVIASIISILGALGIGLPRIFDGAGPLPPTPRPSTPATATGSPVGSASGIWHQGSLTLTEDLWGVGGAGADLDAPPADPQWGVVNLPATAHEDIKWWGLPRVEVPGAEGITFEGAAMGSVETGSADCQSSGNYSEARIPYARLKPEYTICVSTSEQRISSLKIKSVSAGHPFKIAFDVTTFTGAGS